MDTPCAIRKPISITQFGKTRQDDYAWLRDPDWQQVMTNPNALQASIRDYLEAENQYTKLRLADTESLQQILFQEMKGRILEQDRSVPHPDGAYAYFYQYQKGAQHPQYWRQGINGEQLLLDTNLLAEGHDYFHMGDCEHSPDHRYLAYSIDIHGSEYYQIVIIDNETGAPLIDPIERTQGDFIWAPDGESIYYTSLDDNHRPEKVWQQMIHGDKPPTLIYFEADNGFFVSLDITESRRFIIINAHDHITSEIHLIDTRSSQSSAVLMHARETGLEYDVTHNNGLLYILTNADGQQDYKIMTCPLATPAKNNWCDYYVPSEGTLLQSILMFQDYLVRLERTDGLPAIIIEDLRTHRCKVIEFQEQAYELGLIQGYEYAVPSLRFSYTSMTTPNEIYDYQMDSNKRELRKRQVIPSGHRPDDYVTERIQAKGHDGENIPISLLYHKDFPPCRDNPVLLYGYGAYGNSIPAAFSANRLSLVDRGFTYAIAHVRGGMEKGYYWYQQGKLEYKNNTFKDFIACAQTLIAHHYTCAKKIAIHGASAGGLLIGTVLNLRPDLFGCAVADVPFVDVLNTMSDNTLPLTPAEWPEWGNPLTREQDFERIEGYSPYEGVKAQAYPPILVTAGLTDPRVTYWEPAKWVARLRATKTDSNLLCLKTNMSAGHGGASGRFEQLREIALMYSFILKQTHTVS